MLCCFTSKKYNKIPDVISHKNTSSIENIKYYKNRGENHLIFIARFLHRVNHPITISPNRHKDACVSAKIPVMTHREIYDKLWKIRTYLKLEHSPEKKQNENEEKKNGMEILNCH
jgi:hypothetical protein